jgi:uncharacterized protein (TIGR02118 family)
MIRVTVMYPAGGKFDEDYYVNKHMPMVAEKMGASLLRWEADKGVAGGMPGQPATYAMIGYMYFNSLPELMSAMAPNAGAIMSDVPNYTDQTPVLQINEVVKG